MKLRRRGPKPEESERLILTYEFHPSIVQRAVTEQPELEEFREEVERGLRQWFICCAWRQDGEIVDMPSKSVDWVWHSFILHTVMYVKFCDRVYGGYLHHHPVTANPQPMVSSEHVWRRSLTWRGEHLPEAVAHGLDEDSRELWELDQHVIVPA